jgi:chemotaxis protein CheD
MTAQTAQLRIAAGEPGVASYFYFDRGLDSEAVKVLPGEYYVTDRNLAIATVLGSCVSACIRDRRLRVGGMNHFMLPAGGSGEDDASASGRYGAFAMELLINELMKRGAARSNLEAKVFGGGAVMRGFTSLNVGERNAQFVLDFLATERISVVSQDLLDIYPRKVCFFPATGRALVKRLPSANTVEIVEEERRYSQTLDKTPVTGDIELF